MSNGDNVNRQFGYAIDKERPQELDEFGLDSGLMLARTKAKLPAFNPYAAPFNLLQWQGNQGACQGHALSQAPQILLVQTHSTQRVFSRACGYYESQRKDGLNGRDVGSTLRGGQMVLSDPGGSGLCLETDWPYPDRYNDRRPSGFDAMPKIKVPSSKRLRDADEILELVRAGACVQTGVTWNNSFETAVCTRYQRGGRGGHSTLLYGLDQETDHMIHHNSWKNWMGDGRNLWSRDFLAGILLNDRNAVFIAYEPDGIQCDPKILE